MKKSWWQGLLSTTWHTLTNNGIIDFCGFQCFKATNSAAARYYPSAGAGVTVKRLGSRDVGGTSIPHPSEVVFVLCRPDHQSVTEEPEPPTLKYSWCWKTWMWNPPPSGHISWLNFASSVKYEGFLNYIKFRMQRQWFREATSQKVKWCAVFM